MNPPQLVSDVHNNCQDDTTEEGGWLAVGMLTLWQAAAEPSHKGLGRCRHSQRALWWGWCQVHLWSVVIPREGWKWWAWWYRGVLTTFEWINAQLLGLGHIGTVKGGWCCPIHASSSDQDPIQYILKLVRATTKKFIKDCSTMALLLNDLNKKAQLNLL